MNIVKQLSPNFTKGRNGWKPDMIVSHITEGSFAGAVNWLRNPQSKASSHYVVAKDGRITQLVELTDSSWCNGTSVTPGNNRHFSLSTLPKVRERRTNANFYTITIEHEGFSNQGNGRLTDAQLQATIWLHKHIISEVKRIFGIDIPINREHIVGHYQINPKTKPNCPGANFPFDEVIKALRKDDVKLIINGRPINAELKLDGGRTYVLLDGNGKKEWIQIKALSDLLGANLTWNASTRTATMIVR